MSYRGGNLYTLNLEGFPPSSFKPLLSAYSVKSPARSWFILTSLFLQLSEGDTKILLHLWRKKNIESWGKIYIHYIVLEYKMSDTTLLNACLSVLGVNIYISGGRNVL